MDWLKTICAAIANFFGAIKKGEELVERKQDRDAGANAQTVTDQAAENKRLKHALDVATNPPNADDSLRDGSF